jgi:hypothetical protein
MNEAMIVSPLNWFLGPRVLEVHEGPVKQKTKTRKTGHHCQVAVFRSSGAFTAAINKQIFDPLFPDCRTLEVSVLPSFWRINPALSYPLRPDLPDKFFQKVSNHSRNDSYKIKILRLIPSLFYRPQYVTIVARANL